MRKVIEIVGLKNNKEVITGNYLIFKSAKKLNETLDFYDNNTYFSKKENRLYVSNFMDFVDLIQDFGVNKNIKDLEV